jgi:hypothetical protein
MWKRVVWVAVILIFGVSLVGAQDDAPAVIGAENIDKLESVRQVNFSVGDYLEYHPRIENGWFVLSNDGKNIAVLNPDGFILFWTEAEGKFFGSAGSFGVDNLLISVLDMRFKYDNKSITMLGSDGKYYYIAEEPLYAEWSFVMRFPLEAAIPLSIWESDESPYYRWVEFVFSDGDFSNHVLRINHYDSFGYTILILNSPANDPESVIRIGRIDPPLAVTVTEDGRVKRWNMETGEVTAEVQVDTQDGLPIYGALNAGGDSDLVWRDPASKALHILNFETGEDRTVVPLDGAYIPFFFLTQQSDVIIGVNIDDQPIVVAWNVETGERYNLGRYRECNRPPDMVRLSQDGTTLVIGCDTGLDIWRVRE